MKHKCVLWKKALRAALFVLLLSVVGTTKANPVDMNTAREVGFKFINANVTPMRGINDLQLVTTYNISRGDAAFYVFNTPNGFVIVSADDCATPILGYSDEGQFDLENIPVQMQDYLLDFVEQIQYGIENHIVAEADIARQWDLVQATGRLTEQRATRIVAPLLSETWSQGCYYNEKCPEEYPGQCGHVWTGCVATAMGQIMHYWRHPMTGTGSFSYTPSGYPEQLVDFGSTTYQWANMPDRLYSTSDSTAIDAVSTLLWHCGVAVRTRYGINGSAAYSEDVQPALRDYFHYSNDMQFRYKWLYPLTTWKEMLKDCLIDTCPIYYAGAGSGDHAFVCDGYDSNDEFHFNWGWGGSHNGYFALGAMNPGENHNYNVYHRAIFNIRPNYQVLATCSPSNGGTVSGAGSYTHGTNVTLTAEANDGYGFCYWQENGEIVSTNSNYSFIANCNRTLEAVFHVPYHINVNASPVEGGTVAGAGNYYYGQSCTVTATPAAGYSFHRWTENGSVVHYQPNYSFSVDRNRNLVAIFTPQSTQTYTISVSANPTNGGSITGGGNYQQGQSCTVTATPNSGYTFINWTENGNQVSTNANYTFNVTDNRNLVANFTSSAPPPQTYAITVSANPTNGGSVTGGNTYQQGASCTVTATPATGYSFQKWTVNGVQVSTNANYTFTVTGNRHLVAHFTSTAPPPPQTYTITVSANPSTGGSVSGGGNYQQGQSCTVTATANSGYTFTNWTENGTQVSTNANYTFTVTGNRNLVANFIVQSSQTYTISVSANPSDGGSVSGGGDYQQGQSCTVTATPEACYTFTNWKENGNVVSTDESYTFIVNNNRNLTANFHHPQTHTITLTANLPNAGRVTGGGDCYEGVAYLLKAYPNEGYVFLNWSKNGEVLDCNSSYWHLVTESAEIEAVFMFVGDAIVGEGEATHAGLPSRRSMYSLSQQIYNSDEVGEARNISSVSFYNAGETATRNFEIYMVHTDKTVFDSNNDWIAVTEADRVFSGDVTLTKGYWTHIFLDTLFAYNGTSNLAIIVDDNTGSYSSTRFRVFNANGDQSIYTHVNPHASSYNYDPLDPFGHNGTRASVKNQIILNVPFYDITATINNPEAGTITGDTGQYITGSTCTLSATPNEGYLFLNWSINGEVVSCNSTYTFCVDGDAEVEATFMFLEHTLIGEGEATSTDLPSNSHSRYSLTQQIYTSDEIGEAGSIASIFYFNTGKTETRNYDIFMVHTDKVAFDSNHDWITVTESDRVFSGSVTMTKGYWTRIAFDTPFAYNGTSNIAIIVDDNTGGKKPSNNIIDCRVYDANGKQAINGSYYWTVNYNPYNPSEYNGTRYSQKNQILFTTKRAITVAAYPTEVGTVSGGGSYEQDSTCIVTATANCGYIFTNWTENGDVVSTDAEYSFIVNGNRNLVAHFVSVNGIVFADANVKAICVANWDDDGDGELSYAEAAVVTDLDSKFRNESNITSFDELQYFVGLTSIGSREFDHCSGMTSIVIPNSVTSIGNYAFSYCSGMTSIVIPNSMTSIGNFAFFRCTGLTSMTVLAEEPPALGWWVFSDVIKSIPVYVPCSSLEAYQSAAGWSAFTNIQEFCMQSQTIELSAGWNWISTYVDITLDDLKTALVEALPGTAISIKSQTQNTSYNPNNHRWVGSLVWDVAKMYMIKVAASCEISFEGMPINPAEHPVTIVNGANWIGFPLNANMSLANTFAGFAANGDRVKSQTNNALYNGIRWQGQLNMLMPGKGYIYISNSTGERIFTFPTSAK